MVVLRQVRTALAAPGPLPLLLRCAALISRSELPHGLPAPEPDPDELITALAAVDRVESTAVLRVLGELHADASLRARAHRHSRARSHHLPAWLTGLTPVQVRRTVRIDHVLGGRSTLLVELCTGTGAQLCLAVSTHPHAAGPSTDTSALAIPVETVLAQVRAGADDVEDLVIGEPALTEVRSRLAAATEGPVFGPLAAWVLRQLPAIPASGAPTGPPSPWLRRPPVTRGPLVERFLVSTEGSRLPATMVRELLPPMLRAAGAAGAGDPRRWGPDTVELLLLELLPTGVPPAADPPADDPDDDPARDSAARIPDLVRAFVRFGHAECGIRSGLTEQTLAAIDRATLLLPAPPADVLPRRDERQVLLGLLAAAVGGRKSLATLDAEPLPDEPLDLSALPVEIRGRVTAVAELVDRCCQTLFDHELRNACRRLLLDVAVAEPGLFGPDVSVEATAATVVWAVAKANHRLGTPGGDPPGGGLGGWFGLEGVGPSASGATALLAALGITSRVAVRDGLLGSPRYLIADRRRQLIASRDRILTP